MLHKGWSAAQRKDPDMLIKANYFSLTPRRFIAGTKNSYGVETISFEFSSEWDGLNKTVTFYPVGGAPVAVLYVDSPVYIPAEVMACPGTAQFTVSGTKGSRSLISVTGYIDVLDTNDPGSQPAVEPTPSEMAQVLDMMRAALDAANGIKPGESKYILTDADNIPETLPDAYILLGSTEVSPENLFQIIVNGNSLLSVTKNNATHVGTDLVVHGSYSSYDSSGKKFIVYGDELLKLKNFSAMLDANGSLPIYNGEAE